MQSLALPPPARSFCPRTDPGGKILEIDDPAAFGLQPLDDRSQPRLIDKGSRREDGWDPAEVQAAFMLARPAV